MIHSKDNLDDVDIGSQLSEPKYILFIPLETDKVKTRKPLEMQIYENKIGGSEFTASHMVPTLSPKGGMTVSGDGATEEEATGRVFRRLQSRLHNLREDGMFSMKVERAYLEAVLDMPLDYNPDEV